MIKKETFVSMALLYLGFPAIKYNSQLNGCDVDGFDCSGFVNILLKQAKYPEPIPRHANEMFDVFGILIHKQFRGAGDLIFFSNRGGTYPDHVGIMISRDKYIHLPGGKNICIGRFEKKIIKPRNKAPQIYFSNPIGIKRITITINNGRYQRYQQMFLK